MTWATAWSARVAIWPAIPIFRVSS
jgi:hypothetical protein